MASLWAAESGRIDTFDATSTRVTKPSPGWGTFTKCRYCRGKKCKCKPEGRNWALGEKCEACERGGQPCGPNERFERHNGRTPASIPKEPGCSQPLIHQASSPSNAASTELYLASLGQFGGHAQGAFTPAAQWRDDGWGNATDEVPWTDLFLDTADLQFDEPDGTLISSGSDVSQKSLAGLRRLGALHVAYEYLHDWKKALPSDFATLDKKDLCRRLEKSIDLANWIVETAFRNTLIKVIESAQESSILQQELVLRKALKTVERFENVVKRPGLVDGAQKVHSKILRHLIAIAQTQNEIVEVTYLQGELSILDSLDEGHSDINSNQTLAQSLQKSASLAYDVLWHINMPPEVRNTLLFTRQTTLHTACRAMHAGFEDVAEILSSDANSAETLLPDVLKRSLVHIAVETRSLKLLRFLIKQNPSLLDHRDALKRTPLLIAAAEGNLTAYDILVNAGAEIRARDIASRSVLNHACASGSFEMVEKLLKGGADINDDSFGVSSPLCDAASRGHYEICSLLLEHRDCPSQLTIAAELAEKNGHHTVATFLQQSKALYSTTAMPLLRDGLSSRSTPVHICSAIMSEVPSPLQLPQSELPSLSSALSLVPEKTLTSLSKLTRTEPSHGAEILEDLNMDDWTDIDSEDDFPHGADPEVKTAEPGGILAKSLTGPGLTITKELSSDGPKGNPQPSSSEDGPTLENHGTRNASAVENNQSEQPDSSMIDESPQQPVDSRNPIKDIIPGLPTSTALATKMAQEEQTEPPGSIKSSVDSTCAIQSPPLACNGYETAFRASEFGMRYETPRNTSDSDEDRIDADSDSVVWTECSENTPEWDPSGAILAPMKQEYIDRLLLSFNIVRRQWRSHVASDQGESSDSTGSRSEKRRATAPPSGDNSENSPTKRTKRQSADNGGDGDSQGGDDDENDRQKSPLNIPEDSQRDCLFFACPYVKRYPHRYRKCYGHILKDVARVKYHLFRDKVHRLPIYCPTCSESFANEDLRDEHAREATCPKRPQVKWEGITAGQREQLNKRSPSKNTAVQNWNAVYTILFPDDPLPSSPYIDMSLSETLCAFREHELSEGPPIWNEILRARLPENLQPFLEELQSFHQTFYAESVARLCESWNSRHSTAGSLKSQPGSSPRVQQEAKPVIDPTCATAAGPSNSPSRSDSALGSSVAASSQNGNKSMPRSASQRGFLNSQVRQQRAAVQRELQPVFAPPPTQAAPHVLFQTPQTPSFMPMQLPGDQLHAQHPFVRTGQLDQSNPQFLLQPPQMSFFTPVPGIGNPLDAQYTSGSTGQFGPVTAQIQYQQPAAQPNQAGSYQPYPMQSQMEPQFSYQMPAALPLASLPSFGNPLNAERAHYWPNFGTQTTVIDPSAGLQGAQNMNGYLPTGGNLDDYQM